MLKFLLVAIALGLSDAVVNNDPPGVMNKGGIPYKISNPPGSTPHWDGQAGDYSTDCNTNVKGPVEHFDVYGEVQTKYSQVYWTRNAPIELPPELVKRFQGKTMAITGYEVDQVTHTGPQTGSSTTAQSLGGFACYPDCGETDKSVPSYHAYNHHYFSWLVGKDAEVYDRNTTHSVPNPTKTGVRTKPNSHGMPTNIVFKENPGGEFRKSYHGYPNGYAQLIHSPTQWLVEPMQIDTHNRDYELTDLVGYKPSFLPKIQQNKVTDHTIGLSPLMECPCSTRNVKTIVNGTGYITYMNGTARPYRVSCLDEPRSDMRKHGDGTGRDVPNSACNITSYHGGLHCCWGGHFLTDLEQDHLIPNKTDTYFLKWRYYFQEYIPASTAVPASHRHLHHWVFLIDALVNDYEEDNAHYGTESVGKITAHLQAKDMGLEDIPAKYSKITPLVITPHFHAPSGIREELWNADTGEILCNVTAEYNRPEYGATSDVFNEANYVAIPPCIFGDQPGLQKPFTISPETNLYAIKYFNNTFRHLGQMAQWTGMMVYDSDPYFYV